MGVLQLARLGRRQGTNVGGFIGVLAAVPWATIIDAAPEVVAGASKLLRQVGLMREKIPATDASALISRGTVDPESLTKTIEALEASLVGLNAQMGDATRLIGELAEANRLLSTKVYSHRLWLQILAGLSASSIGLAIYSVLFR